MITKKIRLLLSLFVVFNQLNVKATPDSLKSIEPEQKKGKYAITGFVEGLPDNVSFYLVRTVFRDGDANADTVQQVKSIGQKFRFKGVLPGQAEMYFIRLDSNTRLDNHRADWIRLILENNSDIHIKGRFKTWPVVSIIGSPETHVYESYVNESKPYINRINEHYLDSVKMATAVDAYRQFALSFVNANKKSIIIPLILSRNQLLSLHVRDSINKILPLKVNKSLYGIRLSKELEIEKRVNLIANATASGSMPDFSITMEDGTITSILNLVGAYKYTLIDFWASWCGPCRQGIPKVKEVFEVFHKKGFNVIGVSIDKSQQNWKKALNEEAMPWTNGIDDIDYANENIFKFGAIPAYFLIDSKGTIIATSLISSEKEFRLLPTDINGLSFELKKILSELML